MSTDAAVAALVLAAGGSSRMGRPKQLLPIVGRSLVRHCVETARAVPCDPVLVVVGADAEAVRGELEGLGAEWIENEEWEAGLAGSIRCGMGALCRRDPQPEAVLVLLADQPRVTRELLREIVAAHRERGFARVGCTYGGSIGPPALFARRHFPGLLGLEGDRGAKTLLAAGGDDLARIPFPEGVLDVDTPEDYARLLRVARGEEDGPNRLR